MEATRDAPRYHVLPLDAIRSHFNSLFTILNSLFKKGRISWIRPFAFLIQWIGFDSETLLGRFIRCFGTSLLVGLRVLLAFGVT
jgi:hypothetical protein